LWWFGKKRTASISIRVPRNRRRRLPFEIAVVDLVVLRGSFQVDMVGRTHVVEVQIRRRTVTACDIKHVSAADGVAILELEYRDRVPVPLDGDVESSRLRIRLSDGDAASAHGPNSDATAQYGHISVVRVGAPSQDECAPEVAIGEADCSPLDVDDVKSSART
jgi:hypothetical protein